MFRKVLLDFLVPLQATRNHGRHRFVCQLAHELDALGAVGEAEEHKLPDLVPHGVVVELLLQIGHGGSHAAIVVILRKHLQHLLQDSALLLRQFCGVDCFEDSTASSLRAGKELLLEWLEDAVLLQQLALEVLLGRMPQLRKCLAADTEDEVDKLACAFNCQRLQLLQDVLIQAGHLVAKELQARCEAYTVPIWHVLGQGISPRLESLPSAVRLRHQRQCATGQLGLAISQHSPS